MFYFRLNTKFPMLGCIPLTCLLEEQVFENNMCAGATLREFAISLIPVISYEPVKVDCGSRNFSEEQRVYRWQ